MINILDNLNAAAIASGVLTLAITLLSMDGPHWERKFVSSKRAHETRGELVANYYSRRPRNVYGFVDVLALGTPVESRKERYRLRAERALDLEAPLREDAAQAARDWIDSVGAFALEARRRRVALRPFLATYHLGVIREAAICVPIAISLLKQDLLTELETDRLGWGFCLLEQAVRYNRTARQQRQAVFFSAVGHKPPVGPVLRAPSSALTVFYNLIDVLNLPFRLPPWGRWRWTSWLKGVAMSVQYVE